MTEASAFRPKKSVALSGVTAGNTALCTVGRTGNDLHYRGYDILDIAERCDFEEIAYLLVHGKLPNAAELTAYKRKLQSMRGIPAGVKRILESIPANTGAIGALKGPKHGGANEFAFDTIGRYDTPDEADADIVRRVAEKQVIIGFGHPVYTVADPRNQVIKEVARTLSQDAKNMKLFDISARV